MRILDRDEAQRRAEARLRGDRAVPLEVLHRAPTATRPGAYLFGGRQGGKTARLEALEAMAEADGLYVVRLTRRVPVSAL